MLTGIPCMVMRGGTSKGPFFLASDLPGDPRHPGIVENEICPVLIGFTDKSPRLNPNEVESVKWVNWPAFVASLEDSEVEISPWAVEEVRELLLSDIFKSEYSKRTFAGR